MSKTFIAVDRRGNRRLYLGNHLPSWWIKLSLRLHGWTGEPLVKIAARRWKAPWRGPSSTASGNVDTDIARMEIASTKVCGWCGGRYDAWMDLDEWVCYLCAAHPERLP